MAPTSSSRSRPSPKPSAGKKSSSGKMSSAGRASSAGKTSSSGKTSSAGKTSSSGKAARTTASRNPAPGPPSTSTGFRLELEKKSRPLLIRLSALPRVVPPLLTLALVAIGAVAPLPVALLAFVVVLLFVAWATYLSWPAIPTSGKALRLAMLALIVILAATRLL